jgi:hypothetical protein
VVAAGVAVADATLAAVAPVAALGAGWERAAVEIVAQATSGWVQIGD